MAKTYADRAKTIMNKYKSRLGEKFDKGDTLALEAMNQELSLLRKEQEIARAALNPELGVLDNFVDAIPQHWAGGNLDVNSLPKHKNGAMLRQLPVIAPIKHLGANAGINPNALRPNSIIDPRTGSGGIGGGGEAYKSRVPWMGAATGIVGSLMMNKPIKMPEYNYEEYKPQEATANLVDYGREREQVNANRDLAQSIILGQARGTGSQAGLMENVLAGTTGTQRVAGEQFGQSLQNEGNMNAQILNQTSQFNAGLNANAEQMNMRNKMHANQIDRENTLMGSARRDAQTQGIMDSIKGYAKDTMRANQYDQMLHMSANDNTAWEMDGEDTPWKKFLQMPRGIKRTTVDTEKDAKIAAYGGSLSMFNDDDYGRLMMRVQKNKKAR